MMGSGAAARGSTASAALAGFIAVLVLASCSASPPHPDRTGNAAAATTPAASTAGTPSPGTSALPTGTNKGQLGSTLPVSDSSGTQLDVTLAKVIDPASGASSYSKPAAGKHFVGVKLRVQNKAAGTYQNNANNETTIVLSNGRTLLADYSPIANCGNFDNGQINLKSGATGSGCVTFQVPKGQQVVQVRYRNTVFPGTTAQWSLR